MRIKQVIDLSIPVSSATPVYPGDPSPAINPAATIEKDGFNVTMLHLCTHTGTHLDAPLHRQQEGLPIDRLKLEHCIGRGHVIDVTGRHPGEKITLESVADQINTIQQGELVLFHTGWDKYIDTTTYFKSPYLDVSIIHTLLEKNITSFFIDASTMDPADGECFPVHDAITSANGIMGECLCNLDKVTFESPLILALPLKLVDLDGSPVRAVAIEIE